jgi:hypothetical protein
MHIPERERAVTRPAVASARAEPLGSATNSTMGWVSIVDSLSESDGKHVYQCAKQNKGRRSESEKNDWAITVVVGKVAVKQKQRESA